MRPYKVLLFIAITMAILGTLYWAFPDVKLLNSEYSEHSEYADVDTIAEFPVYAEETDTVPEEKPQPVIPKIIVDSTTDSRIFLRRFYASLNESDQHMIRVLHYGDSQIEEDRMTQQIREALQARFGGKGVGLMPLAQTIPSLTVRQSLYLNGRFANPSISMQRYMVYGPKSMQRTDGLYGIMGQMAVMNDSLAKGSENVRVICKPAIQTARYENWRVLADSSIHYTIHGDTVDLTGRGNVYGLSQESTTGVIVDNLPMRGCLGLVFTKMDSMQLATTYRNLNVRLIIMQYGGNAIPFNRNPGTISSIVRGLREQVRHLQACAPNADILFIGPSDMLTQTDGEWHTYPMVPYMDRLLRKMALEENIAYFSLYRWMGGAGSMLRWQEVGLAGSDGVHFNRAGARKAGNAVANWILEDLKTEE